MAPANRLTLFEGERASVWYYPKTKIVHHQFRAFVFGDEFRNVLMKGLEAFEKYGASKWLSDDRGNTAVATEDRDWAETSWTPRVMAAGWKHWALVMPAKMVGQMSMGRAIKMFAERGITVRTFPDPDEAMAWRESE